MTLLADRACCRDFLNRWIALVTGSFLSDTDLGRSMGALAFNFPPCLLGDSSSPKLNEQAEESTQNSLSTILCHIHRAICTRLKACILRWLQCCGGLGWECGGRKSLSGTAHTVFLSAYCQRKITLHPAFESRLAIIPNVNSAVALSTQLLRRLFCSHVHPTHRHLSRR